MILIAAVIIGLGIGWVRYWMGFLVIFQGLIAAGLINFLFGLMRTPPPHGPALTNEHVWKWSAIGLLFFWSAQIVGVGLAQPWFDPLNFFDTIIKGKGIEAVFGLTQTRGIAAGFSGWMWIFCNALDALIMWVLLAVFLRDTPPDADNPGADSDDDADEDDEDEDDDEADKDGKATEDRKTSSSATGGTRS
jgi:hypothetical protein